MKFGDVIRTANQGVWRNPLRALLTMAAIFIGAFTLSLTNGLGSGISDYVGQQAKASGSANTINVQLKPEDRGGGDPTKPRRYDPDHSSNPFGGFGGPGGGLKLLTQEDVDAIRKQEGIIDATPLKNARPSYLAGPSGDKYEFAVSGYVQGDQTPLAAGKLPDNTGSEFQVLLPQTYLESLGFTTPESAVGGKVKIGITDADGVIQVVPATVVGVPRKTLIAMGATLLNQPLLDKLYSYQSAALPENFRNRYLMVIAHHDPKLTEKQVTDLKDRLSSAGYRAQTTADMMGTFQTAIDSVTSVLNIFGIIALLAAVFGVANTLIMSIQERTREIGLMKSLGMRRGKIFALFSFEAALLGFWGSVLGCLGAFLLGQLINAGARQTFLKDLEGFQLLMFPPMVMVKITLIIMVVTYIAGTLPALRASRLNPIDALRYE